MTTILAHHFSRIRAARRVLPPVTAVLLLALAGECQALRVRTDDMLVPFPHRTENLHSQHFESHVGDFLMRSSDIFPNRRPPAEAKCDAGQLLIAHMTKK